MSPVPTQRSSTTAVPQRIWTATASSNTPSAIGIASNAGNTTAVIRHPPPEPLESPVPPAEVLRSAGAAGIEEDLPVVEVRGLDLFADRLVGVGVQGFELWELGLGGGRGRFDRGGRRGLVGGRGDLGAGAGLSDAARGAPCQHHHQARHDHACPRSAVLHGGILRPERRMHKSLFQAITGSFVRRTVGSVARLPLRTETDRVEGCPAWRRNRRTERTNRRCCAASRNVL
jgi:hypothetical protein